MSSIPLFWCIDSQTQAQLMQWQFDNYGEVMEVPTPPMTSKGVWLATQTENIEEIDRLMRQAPKSPTRVQ